MSEYNQARREGVVKFGYDFDSVAEVTALFGKKATRLPYHNWFWASRDENLMAILLSENGGEGWSNVFEEGVAMDSRGWAEVCSITEKNTDQGRIAQNLERELAKPTTRLVFRSLTRDGAHWYKFLGVFQLDAEASKATRATGEVCCVYSRIASDFHLKLV